MIIAYVSKKKNHKFGNQREKRERERESLVPEGILWCVFVLVCSSTILYHSERAPI